MPETTTIAATQESRFEEFAFKIFGVGVCGAIAVVAHLGLAF